jgi:hypothetical protein
LAIRSYAATGRSGNFTAAAQRASGKRSHRIAQLLNQLIRGNIDEIVVADIASSELRGSPIEVHPAFAISESSRRAQSVPGAPISPVGQT